MEHFLGPSSMAAPPPPPQPPPLFHKPNMNLFYYGLVVIGTTAVVLALYNLITVGWCAGNHRRNIRQRSPNSPPIGFRSQSFESFGHSSANLISAFKYRREEEVCEQASDNECAVCLCVFEEGEDVRQLPRCKHSFHAPCIDMWLYSHSDCPLCRAIVAPPPLPPVARRLVFAEEESYRGSLPESSSPV
ncbi:hypothetical protein GIB67_002387 [Kingdonia uniflora]|uniref:RING-type E3 ubiquitin transferase n=1 Tax=Kingdonia uniflora TaxID=39325 RepID=A0A7J7M8C0_9MAGN|nr:hypothetical protein GIB67_002387 [Kingdonia uniflora]